MSLKNQSNLNQSPIEGRTGECSNQKLVATANFGMGDYTGQISFKDMDTVDFSLPIADAMEGLIHGLYEELRSSSRKMTDQGSTVASDDELIVDVNDV